MWKQVSIEIKCIWHESRPQPPFSSMNDKPTNFFGCFSSFQALQRVSFWYSRDRIWTEYYVNDCTRKLLCTKIWGLYIDMLVALNQFASCLICQTYYYTDTKSTMENYHQPIYILQSEKSHHHITHLHPHITRLPVHITNKTRGHHCCRGFLFLCTVLVHC